MSKKNTLLVAIIIACCIFSPIIIYYYNLQDNGLSKNPENWAHFGDYLSGVVNTIIALLNLIVLIYLTYWLKTVEDNRSEWNIKELARPYGDLIFEREANSLNIKLLNCGLGPLIITDMWIKDPNDKIIRNFYDAVLPALTKVAFEIYNITNNHSAIAKDAAPSIFRVSGDGANPIFITFLEAQRKYLNNSEITIKYNDMYGRQIKTLTEKIFI